MPIFDIGSVVLAASNSPKMLLDLGTMEKRYLKYGTPICRSRPKTRRTQCQNACPAAVVRLPQKCGELQYPDSSFTPRNITSSIWRRIQMATAGSGDAGLRIVPTC